MAMDCLYCMLSQNQRRVMALTLGVLDGLGLVVSFAVLAVGVALKLFYRDFAAVKAPDLSEHFPHVVMAAAVFSVLTGCFSIHVNISAADWRQVYTNQAFFLVAPFAKIVLQSVELAVLLVTCFKFLSFETTLRAGFAKGFKKRMADYYINVEHKTLLDWIQVHYRCCGPETYQEWFRVKWFKEEFITEKLNSTMEKDIWSMLCINLANDVATMGCCFLHNGFLLASVVPFSCCNPSIMRPCIRWLVEEEEGEGDLHFNYQPSTDATLNSKGCGRALAEGIAFWMVVVGKIILYHSLVKVVDIVVSRHLQTSVQIAIDYADPTQTSPGFLVSCGGAPPVPPGAPSDETEIKRRNDLLADLAFAADDIDSLAELKLAEMDRYNMEKGYMERLNINNINNASRNDDDDDDDGDDGDVDGVDESFLRMESRMKRAVKILKLMKFVARESKKMIREEEEEEEEEKSKRFVAFERMEEISSDDYEDCSRAVSSIK